MHPCVHSKSIHSSQDVGPPVLIPDTLRAGEKQCPALSAVSWNDVVGGSEVASPSYLIGIAALLVW